MGAGLVSPVRYSSTDMIYTPSAPGTPRLRELIDAGRSADEVADQFQAEAEAFAKERVKYFLYN